MTFNKYPAVYEAADPACKHKLTLVGEVSIAHPVEKMPFNNFIAEITVSQSVGDRAVTNLSIL